VVLDTLKLDGLMMACKKLRKMRWVFENLLLDEMETLALTWIREVAGLINSASW